ncbi:hypothetical protein [Roseateles sp.]|uniref:hypothetical protein n=1 Tax=Roseateles sp. TaxID=1971397 RepID=UPI0031D489FB
MNIHTYTISVLALVVLAGCAATPQSISEMDMQERIKLTSGYPGCPSCSKVKTYSSPLVSSISTRFSGPEAIGWINVKLSLALTNKTENFIPQYQLIAQFTNGGDFSDWTEIYIDGVKLSATGDLQDKKCFNSIGSGCSWTQAYVLDAKRVEDAMKSNSGIDLFIGKPVHTTVLANDGYIQRPVAKKTIIGVREAISSSVLAGFVKGLQARGADMPRT